MGVKYTADDKGPCNSAATPLRPVGLVEQYIGSSFDIVKIVYEDLERLRLIADNLELARGPRGYTATVVDNGNGTYTITGENASITVSDGATGVPGAAGSTPVKGVDYFDGADGAAGIAGVTPVKDVDYFDGADGTNGTDGSIGNTGAAGVTPVKGVDYFDGTNGTNGTDGIDGGSGLDGKNGVYISTVYANAQTAPTKPTTGSYDGTTEVVPAGWSSTMVTPVYPDKVFSSTRKYTHNGVSYDGSIWSATAQLSGEIGATPQLGVDYFNGTPISWRGESTTPPLSPQLNWVYRDTDDSVVYIYNGSAWEVMVVDGNDGVGGATSYFHVAYADDINGNGFSQFAINKLFVGTYSNNISADAPAGDALWQWQTVKGDQGIKGDNSYLHIAYADSADGATNFDLVNASTKMYIGQYVDNILADSTDYTDYNWMLTRGNDGAPGLTGIQGIPGVGTASYFHIAYADDINGNGFSQDPLDKDYMGVYADGTALDALAGDALWQWKLTKGLGGANGIPGTNGATGETSYLHVAYADSANGSIGFDIVDSLNKDYIGVYVDLILADSTDPTKYSWQHVKGNQGDIGIPGLSVYITYHDNDTDSIPASPTGDGTTGGWHTNVTTNVNWMSQKVAASATAGSWGVPLQITGTPGTPGANGLTSYFHVAYANSADGSTGFNQTGGTHIGTYVDFTFADSTNYLLYTWRVLTGDTGVQGIAGTNGVNGATSYLHIAYADSAIGDTNFNQVSGDYIGQYVDFILADSIVYTDYVWTKIKGDKGNTGNQGIIGLTGNSGAPGAPGQTSYFHVAYANSADGNTGFNQTGGLYLGTYVDFNALDSTNPALYNWVEIKGNPGTAGTAGVNGATGATSYLHIAYADNLAGTQNFNQTTGDYIGVYVDFIATDSSNSALYTWSLIKGVKGDNGLNGINGTNGINGLRGSKHYYGLVTNGLWSNAAADALITADGDIKQARDVVTLSDAANGFAQTKFWDTSGSPDVWQTVSQVIDGNLVVNGSIHGDKIVAGTMKIGGTVLTATNTLNTNTTYAQLDGTKPPTNATANQTDAAALTAAKNGVTKTDVGLSNVTNITTANIQAGTTKANVGLSNVDNNSTAVIRATSSATAGAIAGWTIDSTGIYSGTKATLNSFAVSGITLHSQGGISCRDFLVRTDGTAEFKGVVKIGATTLDATNTLNTNTTYAQLTGTKPVNNATNNQTDAAALAAAKSGVNSTDVGLGSVSNITTASMRAGVTAANVGLGSVSNITTAAMRAGTTQSDVGLNAVPNYSAATMRSVAAATSGTIAGWTLNSTKMYSGASTALDGDGFKSTAGIILNSDGSLQTPNLKLNVDGSAEFKGTVFAEKIVGDVVDKAAYTIGNFFWFNGTIISIMGFSVTSAPYDRVVEVGSVSVISNQEGSLQFFLRSGSVTGAVVASNTIRNYDPIKIPMYSKPLVYVLPANTAINLYLTANGISMGGSSTFQVITHPVTISVYKQGDTLAQLTV